VGALIYTASIMAGGTQQSTLGMLIVPSAITVEMILLSLALSFKIKKIYEKSQRSELLLRQQSESQKLGRVVSSISHQWRQPLNLISSEIMYLLLLEQKGKRESITDEFLKNAPKLQSSINYMSQTLNLFTNFYKPHAAKEEFALKESLETLRVLAHHELTLNNISLAIECDESLRITTDKASLLNIVMIFLENAIYELSQSDTSDKEIRIEIAQKHKNIKLLFMDNAQNRLINSSDIFELDSSMSKNSSGLGLKIAKELAHTKLDAKIGAYTKKPWSVFWLEFAFTKVLAEKI
jgi:signal transduction histidine kinase